jgi:hypothetical protein
MSKRRDALGRNPVELERAQEALRARRREIEQQHQVVVGVVVSSRTERST